MSYDDEGPFHEPFGPEYVRPANADCPDCDCCTAVLCATGRASVLGCVGHAGDEAVERVRGCPCSAESTKGTLAWRAGMIRAVTFATEKPLREALEQLLFRIADGEGCGSLADLLPKLTVRRYVRVRPDGAPELTDFGRAYVGARRGARRIMSVVTVRFVDREARTVQVLIPSFSSDQLVTAPMDQLVNSRTGLTVDTAGSVTLHADVNVDAREADDVVLTKVRNPHLGAASRPGVPQDGDG
ncbi:hypothetical protein ACFVH9_08650 [Streptomyces hirsutus]|uniref:hypothetical protein n=1 Tax=Streptomyces hirsutus TaxID=35620 RepID=UPI0036332B74